MALKVKVAEASDEDMARIFEIGSLAFQNNEPFWDLMWPNHQTPAGRSEGADRITKINRSDPNTHYVKAVDLQSGAIVGWAKWNVYDDCIPDLTKIEGSLPGQFDEHGDEAYLLRICEEFIAERIGAIVRTKGNVCCLDVLAIDPAYQRRGAGGALVAWGTDRADQLGVEAVVESSVYGKGLYEKHGFVFIKDVELIGPQDAQYTKYKDRPRQRFAWLVRPKKS